MPINGTCPDCIELREELGNAIKAHIKLLGQMQLAAMENDSPVVATLNALLLAAEQQRAEAKAKFREHEATHNGNDQNGRVTAEE
jgi:hypothetical protein